MNEVIEQDSRYPEWLKAWNAKAAEIDEQIINFFSGGRDRKAAGSADELDAHLAGWWDKQDLDATSRSQYESARKDKYFSQRVQDRVNRLESEGRFTGGASSAGGYK